MRALMVAALMVAFAAAAPATPAAAQTVERLYVMDCGHNAATDQARWSPGVNVGKPIELSDNCYLIKHGGQWLLWDTGYPDLLADKPVTTAIGTATPRQEARGPARRDRRQAGRHHHGRRLAHPSPTMSATSTCSRPRRS